MIAKAPNTIAFWQEIETHNAALETDNRSSLLSLCFQVCAHLKFSDHSLSPMEPYASTHACAWILERKNRQAETQKPVFLSVKRKRSWIDLAEARRSNARQSPSTMSASQSLKQV